MTVTIDEARRHHVVPGVDGFLALDRVAGDRGNLAIPDTDVTDCIEPRLGVHDAAVHNDQVLVCSGQWHLNEYQRHEQDRESHYAGLDPHCFAPHGSLRPCARSKRLIYVAAPHLSGNTVFQSFFISTMIQPLEAA